MVRSNLKIIFLISLFFVCFLPVSGYPLIQTAQTIEWQEFNLSNDQNTLEIFKSNSSFLYSIKLYLNITTLENDNLTVNYFTGDLYFTEIYDSTGNFTTGSTIPFLRLALENKNLNGVASGVYKLEISKKTLFQGVTYPLIIYMYELFVWSLVEMGLSHSLSSHLFFITLFYFIGV